MIHTSIEEWVLAEVGVPKRITPVKRPLGGRSQLDVRVVRVGHVCCDYNEEDLRGTEVGEVLKSLGRK